ncbi:Uncharacterised protein [Mycobacteroides abscessus subsp. abscessus]|nr:Uncharacterised protein [Mycobacteroides abscessus subsp. abscessus]
MRPSAIAMPTAAEVIDFPTDHELNRLAAEYPAKYRSSRI